MYNGKRPIGAAKGKQTNTTASFRTAVSRHYTMFLFFFGGGGCSNLVQSRSTQDCSWEAGIKLI